jgi:hypothetical protein
VRAIQRLLEPCANPFRHSLALCELYLSLSALALRVMPQMRLYDTVDADLAYDHDMFIPMTKDDRGVRVAIE